VQLNFPWPPRWPRRNQPRSGQHSGPEAGRSDRLAGWWAAASRAVRGAAGAAAREARRAADAIGRRVPLLHTRLRLALAAIGALVVVGGLVGLIAALAGRDGGPAAPAASPSGFDREAYCAAMHAGGEEIDWDKINTGDPEALAVAREQLGQLAKLAPPSLTAQWTTIVSGLDSMIAQAQETQPVDAELSQRFRDDFGTVYQDYQDHCATTAP
jgi:hypothetical protein